MNDVNYARSKKNGIVFQSTVFPMINVEAIRDESGQIRVIVIPGIISELFDFLGTLQEEDNQGQNFKRRIIIADLILIVLSFFTKNVGLIIAAIYFSLLVSQNFFSFAKVSYEMKSWHGKERSTARYHSAEHMVLNAYRDLKRVPTLEEIKRYSRFSEYCGSRIIIGKIVPYGSLCILLAFSSFIPWPIYFILCFMVSFLVAVANKKGWLKFFQIFITSKPTDAELEVAIEGLKYLQKLDESLESDTFGDEFGISIQIFVE